MSKRVDLVGQLKLAVLQELELHLFSLSLGETELLLLAFLALHLLAQRRQAVKEAVVVVDERHGNHRLGLLRPDVNVVARKHLVVSVDNVQDLDEPGGVGRLLALQELEQVQQLGHVLAALGESGRGVVDLVDEDALGRRREANWRLLDVLCMRTEDLASSDTRHKVQRTERLLLGGQEPPVPDHAVVEGLAVTDDRCYLFSREHPFTFSFKQRCTALSFPSTK